MHNFVIIRLTATLLGNKPFLGKIEGVFGVLLRSEKQLFRREKTIEPIGIAPILDN